MINKKIITTLTILLINLGAINVAYAAAKIGELNFGSKAKYIGEVKKGKANGIGALKTIDGTNYIGKFKNNIVNGEGILIKLHANDKLADLKINDNFPQLNKSQIQGALTDFRENWVNLGEIKDQITDQDEGFFTKLKVQRQNLKKEFFESAYPEWWKDVLKKTNNDEKLLLEGIQIFVGKWKYGTHTEYLDKDKNFRRQTKLQKLNKIDDGAEPDVPVPFEVNQDGDKRFVKNMPIGENLFFTGLVDKNNVPAGGGEIFQFGPDGPDDIEVVAKGDFGVGGKINLIDEIGLKDASDGSKANLTVKFVKIDGNVFLNSYTINGKITDDKGNIEIDGNFTINLMGEGFMTGKGIFRDGSQIYDGEFTNKEGEPIFEGNRALKNGSVFDGVVNLNTRKLVEGKRVHRNGKQSFEGTFGEDGRPKEGIRKYPNGNSFKGTFKDGKPFEGQFMDINGNKISLVENGNRTQIAAAQADEEALERALEEAAAAAAAAAFNKNIGSWDTSNVTNMSSTFNKIEGDGYTYTGELKDGKQNGQGTETFADGYTYKGEFKDGIRSGQGTEAFANGYSYTGEFKNGIRSGQGTENFANGISFSGIFKDGKPFEGNHMDKNGDKISSVENGIRTQIAAAQADEEALERAAAAQAKIDEEIALEEAAAAAAAAALEFAPQLGKVTTAMGSGTNRARRSSVDHSMQKKFGKAYYDVTLSSGDPAVLDSASLSNEVAKAVKADKKNKGKKNKNKRKRLKQKAIKLEKQLSKAKTEKKRAQLEKKRAKLEKQLNKLGLDDLNEVLGLSDQGDDQASIGGGAPSIEISEAGQQQMDDDKAAATAATAAGGDGGSSDSGGSGGSSGSGGGS